ncbi:hypothetical protein EJB05_38535, partial [Eragrostis curvula]
MVCGPFGEARKSLLSKKTSVHLDSVEEEDPVMTESGGLYRPGILRKVSAIAKHKAVVLEDDVTHAADYKTLSFGM